MHAYRRLDPSLALVLGAMLAFAGVFAPCSSARAAGDYATARSIAVINISKNTKIDVEIARAVTRAVAKTKGYVLRDVHATLNAGAEVNGQNDIKTAQGFHKAGEASLTAGDAEDAAAELDSAARLMEKNLALLPGIDEFRTVLLELGEARVKSGDAKGGLSSFEHALIYHAKPGGKVHLDAGALAVFAKAKQAIDERDRGAVSIRTWPAHAGIYLDGSYRGVSPTTLAGLPVGRHVISVVKMGFARQTVPETVSATKLASLTIDLVDARRRPLFDRMLRQITREIDTIDTKLGPSGAMPSPSKAPIAGEGVGDVRDLVLASVGLVVRATPASRGARARRVSLYLFDTANRRLLNTTHVTITWSRRQAREIAALVHHLVDINYARALGGATGKAEGSGGGSITRKWWFWTIIGVAVAGGATAAAVVLATKKSSGPSTTGSLSITF